MTPRVLALQESDDGDVGVLIITARALHQGVPYLDVLSYSSTICTLHTEIRCKISCEDQPGHCEV